MPFEINNKITVTVAGSVFSQPFEYSLDYRAESLPTITDVVGLVQQVRDTIVLPGLAFQHTSTVTNSITAVNRSVPMPPITIPGIWVGSYVAISNLLPPPSLRFGIYRMVGPSFSWDDDSVVDNRPIRRGYKFLPGLCEDFLANGGITIPGDIVAGFQAWIDDLNAELTGGTVDFRAVVTGDDLPATPRNPIPRGEVYAFATDSSFRRMTHMSNSEGPQG